MATKSIAKIMEEITARISIVDSEATVQIYKCEKCKDQSGWIEVKTADVFRNGNYVREEEVWVECSCVQQKRIERMVKASQITEEFQKMGFKNYEVEGRSPVIKKMRDTALDYYNTFKDNRKLRENSIALVGQVGSGKTHLLSAISNGLMKSMQVPVMYFPFVEMIDQMSANNFELKGDIVHKAQQADVLFLDDLFKPTTKEVRGEMVPVPRATPFEQTIMQSIINYRYLNNKPILLSCELTFEELLNINEGLGSRLFEMCANHVVTIDSNHKDNYRMKKLFGGA